MADAARASIGRNLGDREIALSQLEKGKGKLSCTYFLKGIFTASYPISSKSGQRRFFASNFIKAIKHACQSALPSIPIPGSQ